MLSQSINRRFMLAAVLMLALAGVAMGVIGCSFGGGKEAAGLAEAKRTYESGQFSKAEQELTALLKNSPNDIEALKTLALALAAQGKNAQAVTAYERVLQQTPKDDQTWYRMAMLEQILGQPGQTADALKHALGVKQDDPTYTDALARTYMSVGKYADAAQLWGRLAQADGVSNSRKLQLLILEGQAYEAAQNYGSAKKAYAEALKLDPSSKALRLKVKTFK